MKVLRASLLSLFALGNVTVVSAQPLQCIQEKLINTGAVISETLAQQLNEFPQQYLNAPLLGGIHDYNNNGVRDFLSVEGAQLNLVSIRDGATGAVLWGPFNTGAASVPNQLASIGDYDDDGVPEFAIGVRRTSSAVTDGAWVFNGKTGVLIESFPSNLEDRLPKLDDGDSSGEGCSPLGLGHTRTYAPKSAGNVSGMTAAIARIPLGDQTLKKIIFSDTNSNDTVSRGGQALFTHTCGKWQQSGFLFKHCVPYDCYIEATISNDVNGMINRDFGGQMINLRNQNNPAADPELYVSDPSMTSAVEVPPGATPPDLSFSGMIYKYYPSQNVNLSQLLPIAGGTRMGYFMTQLRDLDGDGLEELAVSSPADTLDGLVGGFVDIYKGGGIGEKIKHIPNGIGREGIQFGFSVAGGHDLNQDGLRDLVVGAPNMDGIGRVFVFSATGSDNKPKYLLGSPVGGSRFGHSVVSLNPDRIAVADGSGNLQFIKLGADLTGPQNKPDRIPDRCQVATPTPTPGANSENQKKIDEVFTRMAVSMSAQLNMLTSYQRGSGQVTQLIKGLDSKAKLNSSAVGQNGPIFKAIHPALTKANFDKVIVAVKNVRNTYKTNNRSKIRTARSKLRTEIAKLSGWLAPGVTPSVRSGSGY
jgi:hypothetical protein